MSLLSSEVSFICSVRRFAAHSYHIIWHGVSAAESGACFQIEEISDANEAVLIGSDRLHE